MPTPTPRILIADRLSPAAEDALSGIADVCRPEEEGRAGLLDAAADVEAILVRSATTVDEELLDAAPRLRVVGRAGVGVDNIDVEAATKRGVAVVNTPTANSHSACEHAIALLLAAARCVPAADASVRAGKWERSRFQGVELFGKTVGVVGLGRVGQLFAERMRAFGTRVLAHDPYADAAVAEELGVEMVGLEALMAQSDVVSVHVPKTVETEGMIGTELLAAAKPGQILVNAARGGVVDERALAHALQHGPLRAAGVDVYSQEPPTDSPLFALDNVVLTPHLGASTSEAQQRAGTDVVRAVLGLLGGENPGSVINPEVLGR